jgi:hypothetical protein
MESASHDEWTGVAVTFFVGKKKGQTWTHDDMPLHV